MKFSVPEVKTCCHCISLRTGAKLFGFISLIGCLLTCLTTSIHLTFLEDFGKHGEDRVGLLVTDLVAQVVQLVMSFALLFGIYQEKADLMPWWLVTTVIMVVLEAFVLPSFFLRLVYVGKYLSFDYTVVVISLVLLVDDIYGWLVVYSYYRCLVEQDRTV